MSIATYVSPSSFLVQERRAATALAARELEVTRAVARDGLAGMSRAAAAEAADAAEATAARGAAAGAAAARAEALAAGLTEGMRAMLARLEAAATSAAPFCDTRQPMMPHGAVTDARAAAALVDALEDAARGAVAAAERRRADRVAAARAAEAARSAQPAVDHEPRPAKPPRQPRPRRRVRRMSTDSDGFAYSRSGSEAESGDEAADCSDSGYDGITMAAPAEVFPLCGDASSATVGVPPAPPSVVGSVAASAAPDTSRGSDGGALVTRDALKELAAAAARLQRLPAHRGDLAHAGSGPQATSAAANGGGAAGLLGAARRERAPPARLLSSRTPSADALLHSLQALSRDVDSRTLPSVLHPPAGASYALDALPRKALQVSSPAPSPARRARSATPTAGGRRRGSVAVALASVTSAAGFAVPRPAAAPAASSGRFAAAAAAARGGIVAPMPARARATSPERVRRPAAVPAASSPMVQPFRSASAGAARAPSRGRTASPAPVRPAPPRPPPGALYAAAAAAARSSGGPGSRGGTPTAGRGRASSPAACAAFGATTLRLRTKA